MITVGMSSSCVYPLGIEAAFRLARLGGFDGIEIMITDEPVTRDAGMLRALARQHRMPILSVHAPVFLRTQLVWGTDHRVKLERSAALARDVGASTVVAHPPFRWQRGFASGFVSTVRETADAYGVEVAVENMFPWRVAGRRIAGYSPGFDPSRSDYDAMTLDFSHASMSGRDSLDLALAMGSRLRHVHLCDGTGAVDPRRVLDEHLIPGHGAEPVAEVLQLLARSRWSGSVVAEVNLHAAKTDAARLPLLRETAAFARRHLAAAAPTRTRRSGSAR
jgi:sugar phosphate isomerase/epimerase